jgi:GNAT superfamily N-acetyltransferase
MSVLIRKALLQDTQAIAKVHVDSWRTTYANIVSNEFLESLAYEQREKMWMGILSSPAGQSFVYVAETPDCQVVGFASAGPLCNGESDDAYQGEIYALYLLQNYQRQGIGRDLFRAAVTELNRRGVPSLLIWVLAANPARAFYEAMGGTYVREKEIEIGGQRLPEVAYGWQNILISSPS